MGMWDTILQAIGLGSNQPDNTTQQQQSSGAASSSTPPADITKQPQATPQQQQVLTNDQQQLATIAGILIPAIDKKEADATGQKRIDTLQKQAAAITDNSTALYNYMMQNAENQKGATSDLINAAQLAKLAELDKIAAVDKKTSADQKMYAEQLAPLDAAISEDTKDIGDARQLQNSGNPFEWIWGKIKEGYNQETLRDNVTYKQAIQQQQAASLAVNSAQRSINTQGEVEAQRNMILAQGMVDHLKANQELTGKQLSYLAAQFGLNNSEMENLYKQINIDISKQQLSYQGAYLKIAQAQSDRDAAKWKQQLKDIKSADQAANDMVKYLKDTNQMGNNTEAMIYNAYRNPNQANAGTISYLLRVQAVGETSTGVKTGVAGTVSMKDVEGWGAAAASSDEGRFYINAKNDVESDPTTQATIKAMRLQGATAASIEGVKEQAFQAKIRQNMSDANSLMAQGKLVVPTFQTFADKADNIKIESQKAFDALKQVPTMISTDGHNNSKFFSDAAESATKSGVPLDVAAQQMTTYFKQIAAKNREQRILPAMMSQFNVTIADDFSGSYNGFTGNYGLGKSNQVNLFDSKSVYNLLMRAQQRNNEMRIRAAQLPKDQAANRSAILSSATGLPTSMFKEY